MIKTFNISKANNRQSNIELLRIIIMFAIFINHMTSHGIMLDNVYSSQYTFIQQRLYTIDVTFWIPAAMIFVFISGYFGINTSGKV